QVQRSIANSHRRRSIRRHDAPAGATAGSILVKQFLFVGRKRVGAKAFEERRSSALSELVALQTQSRPRRRCHWFGVKETPGRARHQITVITGRYIYRD